MMDINRREFIRLVSFGTAGFLFGMPFPISSCFLEHRGMSLDTEIPSIKVIGIGGLGSDCVDFMIKKGFKDVKLIAAETDSSSLENNSCLSKIYLGKSLIKGYGCGANPEMGYTCTLESQEAIRRHLKSSDLVFIMAGMGGGTGSGGAPLVASISRDLGIYTVCVVTMPFHFEGERRKKIARDCFDKLKEISDMIVLIPNDSVILLFPPIARFVDVFYKPIEIISCVVKTLSDIFLTPSSLSLAFTDIKRLFSQFRIMRIGIGTDKKKDLMRAMRKAIHSPLLQDISLENERKIMCNVTVSGKETIGKIQDTLEILEKKCHKNTDLFFNTVIKQSEKIEVMLIVKDPSKNLFL